MRSLRAFAVLRPAGWLCLVQLALGAAPPMPPAQTPPPRPSALQRWWNSLGRGYLKVTTDEHGTTVTESGNGGPERVYQTWKDGAGTAQEGYWENGLAKPLDPAVRQWALARIQEAKEVPPPPPMPPQPPQPPAPPSPPPPSAFHPGAAGEAAFHQVQHDARLAARLGTPLSLSPTAHGSLSTWGAGEPMGWFHFTTEEGAAADLTLELTGPRGTARLHAKGERRGATWTFSTLDLTPDAGGPTLNLLHP